MPNFAQQFYSHVQEPQIDVERFMIEPEFHLSRNVNVQTAGFLCDAIDHYSRQSYFYRRKYGPSIRTILATPRKKKNPSLIHSTLACANTLALRTACWFAQPSVSPENDDPFVQIVEVLTNPLAEISHFLKDLVISCQNVFSLINPGVAHVLMSQDIQLRSVEQTWRSLLPMIYRKMANVAHSELFHFFCLVSTTACLLYSGKDIPLLVNLTAVSCSMVQIYSKVSKVFGKLTKLSAVKTSMMNVLTWRTFIRFLLFIAIIYTAWKTSSHAWFFLKRLFGLEDKDEPCAFVIDDVLKLCFALLFAMAGIGLKLGAMDKFLRVASFVGAGAAASKGLSDFISYILEQTVHLFSHLNWNTLANFVREHSNMAQRLVGPHGQLNQLNRDVEHYLNQRTTPNSGPGTESFRTNGEVLLTRIGELANEVSELENNYAPLNMMFHMRSRVESAISSSQMQEEFRDARVEPFSLLMVGGPRIGKTYAANVIRLALKECMKKDTQSMGSLYAVRLCAQEGRWTYSRNFADEFWSSYNHEPIIVYDDIFARNVASKVASAVQRHDNELLELQALISSQPYAPPLPEVGVGIPCPKGTRISPRVVMMTSNFMLPNPGESDSTIIDDRIHSLIFCLPTGLPRDTKLSNIAFFQCTVSLSHLRHLFKNSNYQAQSSYDLFPATMDDFEQWNLSRYFVQVTPQRIIDRLIRGMREKAASFNAAQLAVHNVVTEVSGQEPGFVAELRAYLQRFGYQVPEPFTEILRTQGVANAVSLCTHNELELKPDDEGGFLICVDSGHIVEHVEPSPCGCSHTHLSELMCPNFDSNRYVFKFSCKAHSLVTPTCFDFDGNTFNARSHVQLSRQDFILETFKAWCSHHKMNCPQTFRALRGMASNREPASGLGYCQSQRKIVLCLKKNGNYQWFTRGFEPCQETQRILWVAEPDEPCSNVAPQDYWFLLQHDASFVPLNLPKIIDDLHQITTQPPTLTEFSVFELTKRALTDPAHFVEPPSFVLKILSHLSIPIEHAQKLPPCASDLEWVLAIASLKVILSNDLVRPATWIFSFSSLSFATAIDENTDIELRARCQDDVVVARGKLSRDFQSFLDNSQWTGDRALIPLVCLKRVWESFHSLHCSQKSFVDRLKSFFKKIATFLSHNALTLILAALVGVLSVKFVSQLFKPLDEPCAVRLHRSPPDFPRSQPPCNRKIAEQVMHQTHKEAKKCRFCAQVKEVTVSMWDAWKHEQVVIRNYEAAVKQGASCKNRMQRFLKALYGYNMDILAYRRDPDNLKKMLETRIAAHRVPITYSGTFSPLAIVNTLQCTRSTAKMMDCLQKQTDTIKQILGHTMDSVDELFSMPLVGIETCKIENKEDNRPCWAEDLIKKQRADRGYDVKEEDCKCKCDQEAVLDVSVIPPLYPPDLQKAQAKFSKTLSNLVFCRAEAEKTSTSRGVFVGRGQLFMCRHAIPTFDDPFSLFLTGRFGSEKLVIYPKQVHCLEGTDIAIINTQSCQLPNVSLDHLIMESLPTSKGTKLTVHWMTSQGQVISQPIELIGTTTTNAPVLKTMQCYEATTFDGAVKGVSGALVMCGSQIFGHYYGNRGSDLVLIQPWEKRKFSQKYLTSVFDKLIAGESTGEKGENVLTEMDTKVADAVPKTDLKPSEISDELSSLGVPNVKRPAVLNRVALDKAMAKFSSFEENFDPDYEQAADELGNYLANLMETYYGEKARVIPSWEEVTQGRIGQERICKSVVMDTSAGYPFSESGIAKTDLFVGVAPMMKPSQSLCRILDDVHERFKQGDVTPYVCTTNLKDELRDLTRVQEQKTRLFCATPVHVNMLYRKYCSDWISKYKKLGLELGLHAMGTDVYGDDWNTLHDWLTSPMLVRFGRPVSNMYMAGDFSRFDISHTRWRICQAVGVIAKGCSDPFEVEKLGLMLSNYIARYNGRAFRVPRGLPSGCQLTTSLNCILNTLLWITVWKKCTGFGFEHFRSHTRLVVYGDDVVLAIPKNSSYRHLLTPDKIQRVMREQGYDFESNDEQDLRWLELQEVTFLKRRFVRDQYDLRKVHAPRPLDEIWTQLHWCRRELDLDEVKTVFLAAAMEFGQYGPKVFLEAYDIIRRACRKKPKYLTALALSNFKAVCNKAWEKEFAFETDSSQRVKQFWRLW